MIELNGMSIPLTPFAVPMDAQDMLIGVVICMKCKRASEVKTINERFGREDYSCPHCGLTVDNG